MKRLVFCFLLSALLLGCALSAVAAQDELSQAAASAGEAFSSLLDDDTADTLESFGFSGFSSDGVFDLSWGGVHAFFAATLRESLRSQGRACALALALLLLVACLRALLQPESENGAFDLLSLCAVTVQMAAMLHTYVSAAAALLQKAGGLMQGFVPVYAGLLAFSGHPGAALGYQTLCFALAQGISWFAARLFVPLLGFFFCLGISFSLNDAIRTPAFLSAVNKASALGLGLASGVFAGVLTIRQVLSGAADSASLRGARFLVGSLVPVVGSAMSDAYSAVLCSIDLIKGSALVFLFAALLALHLPVLLQLLIGRVCCGALASLAEMFGEARLSVLYQTFAAGVRLLLVCSIYEGFLLLVSTGLTLQLRQ